MAGQRRSRPNGYTPQACERCRSRKQRCVMDEDGKQICRNCEDSGSVCVYAPRPESSKRGRISTSQPSDSQDTVPTTSPTLSAPHEETVPPAPVYTDWNSARAPRQASELDWTALLSAPADSSWGVESHQPLPPLPLLPPPVLPSSLQNPDSTPAHSDRSVFEAARGLAMISLEAAAEPHYVGESSGSLWSTVIAKGMHEAPVSRSKGTERANPSSSSHHRSPSPERQKIVRNSLQQVIPQDVADHVLLTVYHHLHARYPFMDWVVFDQHWQAREGLLLAAAMERPLNREAVTAVYFILLVLAIGAQLCKKEHMAGLLRSEEYYALALTYLPGIVQLHNLANVQGLLLLAMYSLRDSRGPSVWYLSGVCMRLSISLGLHRNPSTRSQSYSAYDLQMRKRVFWTCYTLDRMMAMTLGRPPGISDDDIDVDLPDPGIDNLAISIQSMQTQSMASAVHYFKLKQIESQIQRSMYTVAARDRDHAVSYSWTLLQRINEWEASIPAEASLEASKLPPCCSRDWFALRGVEARLHLLRPLCTTSTPETRPFLPLLAQNAARGCELQKRTHQFGQPGSSTSAHSTFICGLALLYALFLEADVITLREAFSAIKAASSTLFAYAQGDSATSTLHDVFEELSTMFIDKISNSSGSVMTNDPTPHGWQRASAEATSNLDSTVASDYAEFLRSLGISTGEDNSPTTNPFTESLWDLAVFSPAT